MPINKSFEVVLTEDSLDVAAAPNNISVAIDIGPEGERGSQIFTGEYNPNSISVAQFAINTGETPKYNDVFLRTDSGTSYGTFYSYSNTPGGDQWESILSLIDTMDLFFAENTQVLQEIANSASPQITAVVDSYLASSGSLPTALGTVTIGTWNATTIAANYGGTGQSSYAIGDLLYATSSTTLGKLADVATGNALIAGGVGAAPSWGKIGLTTHVSGTLPVANGGTGTTTSTGTGSTVLSTSPTLTTPNIGSASASYLTVSAQDGTNEGGEIKLNGAGSYPYMVLDTYQGKVRFLNNGSSAVLSGDLEGMNLSASTITLNSLEAGSPTANVSISVERGTSSNVAIRWNESNDSWEFTNDGSSYSALGGSGGLETAFFLGCI